MSERNLGALLVACLTLSIVSIGYLAVNAPGIFAGTLFAAVCLGSVAYWLDRLTER